MAGSTAGFPSEEPTLSYWQTAPSSLADHQSGALPAHADYVIVGSGISGASIALKLLARRSTAKVVMLEARTAASGASGRNGGHCRGGGYRHFSEDLADHGVEEALRIQKFEEDNIAGIAALVEEYKIACDLRPVETVDIFYTEAHRQKSQDALDALAQVFENTPRPGWLPQHVVWPEAEAREKTLLTGALGGVVFPAFIVHPYKLVCGILSQALELGLVLHTHTTVRRIARCTGRADAAWEVHTDRGSLRAANVVLATNAYTPVLCPALAGHIIPTRGQVAAIRPGSRIAKSPAQKRSHGMYGCRPVGYYQQREESDGEHAMIIGGGRLAAPGAEQPLSDDTSIHPVISENLTKGLAGLHGEQTWGEHGRVLNEWTGIMGYSKDLKPFIGEVPGEKGLWVSVAFTGHGMALTYSAAEAVVQLMMEETETDWIPRSFRVDRIAKG